MLKPRSRKQRKNNPNLAVTVHRWARQPATVTMTCLWYDGCELTSDVQFESGERIEVAIEGMGSIRARVTRCSDGTVFVRFDEECPV